MGLFDRFTSPAPSAPITYTPRNEQEAWIAVMYACIAVDGNTSEAEIDKLVQQVTFKILFNGHQIGDYYKAALIAHQQIGSKQLIDSSVSKVSDNSKATLFAMIMELLLSDGILGEQEKEIAEYLATALRLDETTSQKIVEVMVIRNIGNVVVAD